MWSIIFFSKIDGDIRKFFQILDNKKSTKLFKRLISPSILKIQRNLHFGKLTRRSIFLIDALINVNNPLSEIKDDI